MKKSPPLPPPSVPHDIRRDSSSFMVAIAIVLAGVALGLLILVAR